MIKNETPAFEDFLSDKAAGKPLRHGRSRERYEGLSAWRALDAATEVARRFPRIGRYVAALDLPDQVRTWPFEGNASHVTVFAEPAVLLNAVAFVKKVVE